MVRSVDSGDDKRSEKSSKDSHESGMRVGSEFQARIPDILTDEETDHRPEPILVWAPVEDKVSDSKLDTYLKVAKDQYGYNMEQALGMLYWHSYESDKAMEDLKNFTPLPDEWSMEDKVIFEQSFSSYGKSFPRIRQQLPDKSIGALVKYYYAWKKNRNKKSLMDNGERKDLGILTGMFADDSAGDNSSDSDFEPDEKKVKTEKNGEKQGSSAAAEKSPALSTNCVNCAGVTPTMNPTPKGKLCMPCYEYWRRTGVMGSNSKESEGTLYHGPPHKMKKKPPKGMQLTEEALKAAGQTHTDSHIRPLQVELINLKRLLITAEQTSQDLGESNRERASRIEPASKFNQALNPRWTNEELLVAVQCVRKYGKDFTAMSEVLGNKNVSHCRNFFVNYHRRFNLMDVLAEYEKANNIPHSESRVNEAWVEVAEAERENKNTTSNTSNNVAAPALASTDVQNSQQPPPLRRQSDSTPSPTTSQPSSTNPVNNSDDTSEPMDTSSSSPTSQGPPPLINNNNSTATTTSTTTTPTTMSS